MTLIPDAFEVVLLTKTRLVTYILSYSHLKDSPPVINVYVYPPLSLLEFVHGFRSRGPQTSLHQGLLQPHPGRSRRRSRHGCRPSKHGGGGQGIPMSRRQWSEMTPQAQGRRYGDERHIGQKNVVGF